MKWFKIRELPTTSTWLDQPIFSPFPARPGCPTKTSNDGGPQRESGESDVILSFQSAPAPVRAHAHTHKHTRTHAQDRGRSLKGVCVKSAKSCRFTDAQADQTEKRASPWPACTFPFGAKVCCIMQCYSVCRNRG